MSEVEELLRRARVVLEREPCQVNWTGLKATECLDHPASRLVWCRRCSLRSVFSHLDRAVESDRRGSQGGQA